jgi:simple sugar transport system ATP-binding protein
MSRHGAGEGSGPALIALEGITKAYPGVLACDSVDLELREGEIHALLGENGAGKSTLVGLLFGLQQPDRGHVRVKGREVRVRGPRDASALGIGFVQQHFSSIPTLTVAENLTLALRGAGQRIARRKAADRIQELSAKYGLGVDPHLRVDQLSVSGQQRVELLKALAVDPRVLILDEPSSLLGPLEAEELMHILGRMAGEGLAILLISHKLQEVLRVSDRVTVLRRGRRVATVRTAETSEQELAALMVGDLATAAPAAGHGDDVPVAGASPRLRVDDVVAREDRHVHVLRGVSLAVTAGEIVGLAGLEGSGQVELIEVIAGVRPVASGSVSVDGLSMTGRSVRERQRSGVAHVPADRRHDGLVGGLSVAENLALTELGNRESARFGVLRRRAMALRAQDLIARYDIRVPSPSVLVSALSGGNQQKVVLARELSRDPHVILCAYPTWGLDFAATAAVHGELRRRRDDGAAVLVASVDLDELLAICDRILVMQGGRIVGELPSRSATAEGIGRLMGGIEAA